MPRKILALPLGVLILARCDRISSKQPGAAGPNFERSIGCMTNQRLFFEKLNLRTPLFVTLSGFDFDVSKQVHLKEGSDGGRLALETDFRAS